MCSKNKKTNKKNLKVADFFCGAGGFSEGFRQAGFDVVLAVDNWQTAVNTHKANHLSTKVLRDDVHRISLLPDKEFHELIPDVDVIIGSPPCVAFSNSNKSGKGDKSLGIMLIEAYLRIVGRKLHKRGSILKYWLLENVPNVEKYIKSSYSAKELGINGSWVLDVKGGESDVYQMKYYGVPSNRIRYVCGSFPRPPKILTDKSLIPLKKILKALGEPKVDLERIVKDPNYDFELKAKNLTDHHYVQRLARFEHEKAKRAKQDKGYMGRMAFPENLDRPARTIMATMSTSSRESMVFSDGKGGYRSPTIREIATLMSFPVDYRFYAQSKAIKYKLVGNSVPPLMSYALASSIAKKEGMNVSRKYVPLKHDDTDFYNLNLQIFHKKKEPNKRRDARFKYHLPYLIVDAFRVELTNYRSDFEKMKYIWSVEIHKSQGQNAKVYMPNIRRDKIFKASAYKKVDKFIKDLYPHLFSFVDFQKIYCMPSDQRMGMKGPEELLATVKQFIAGNNKMLLEKSQIDSSPSIIVPSEIAAGYYVLKKIIQKMEVVPCKKNLEWRN